MAGEQKMSKTDLLYLLACLYMGMTEKYDRSLTDMRDRYDPTEAFLYCSDICSESNRYAKAVKNKIIEDYHIPWEEIHDEIHRHINFSAQHWADEYERIWK